MLQRVAVPVVVLSLLSSGCDFLQQLGGAADDSAKESKSTSKPSEKSEKGEDLTPKAATCAPVAWSGLKMLGEAKVDGKTLSLLTAPGQTSAAWFPDAVDTTELQLRAVLVQAGDVSKFADGVAFTFVGGEVPNEVGLGGPSLGAPRLPVVAAGIHYPMDEPHFWVELWKGEEGIPFMDTPPARETVPRSKGERLVQLSVANGEVTLAVHTTTEPSSPATVARAKLGLKGKRAFGLTGSTGVYTASLGFKELRVAVGGDCLP